MSESDDKSLSNSVVVLRGGIKVDRKLRIGGMLFIEELFGKPFEQIADDMSVDEGASVSDLVKKFGAFVKALIHQRQPDMSLEDLDDVINDLELEEFTDLFGKVDLFAKSKNAEGPAAPKKRSRQPVKNKR